MRKLLMVLALAVLTAGCGMLYRQPIYQGNLLEKSNVDQLAEGMDKRQVMALLGTPSVADPFHHDRWDYIATERTGRVGKTEVKTLTVFFANDQLQKWEGEYFPEQDKALAADMRSRFGNLPKDKKKKGARH
ncbi:outer membrane protein assembly factor BamE [Lysobacter helvus]|uniref:Outer membrane protein assembly factor BamE n=2 Tax=Lysobacteraceae TaxID=32033 RepID=A0ABN6FWK8_9GAMM|nr:MULTISPECIES: outer membrane protein assembly factor BamE [Lysobacter]BCT93871.1 outer membrane protein assembly factor BamE [Lysobacter caseinilyticus]BCT97027.1 outer membrane protein assembly factor BamE [Lysobacter helvus]